MADRKDVVSFIRLIAACTLKKDGEYPDIQSLDLGYIYPAALKNDVISLLLPAMKYYYGRGEIDRKLFSAVNRRATSLAFEETKKSDYAVRLLKELRAQGTEAFVLKGISLKTLYPYPELRRMSDLDLLLNSGIYEDVLKAGFADV